MTLGNVQTDLLVLAGCGVLAFLWGVVTVSWRLSRSIRRLELCLRAQEPDAAALRSELAGIGAAVTTLALRFDRLSAQLSVDARHSAGAGPGDRREVDLAVRGARQGASEDDLVADFGMSRQEAALLRRLHCTTPPTLTRHAIA